MEKKNETAVFGGGCFWCTEAVFKSLKGVVSVMPGYAGGSVKNARYEQVLAGKSGHAESVRIEFDPAVVSYEDLLAVFFNAHDPTTLNRQGNDIGPQYRSAIFYLDEAQKEKAEAFIKELDDSHAYENPVVTEVKPLAQFYEAESYHRDYYRNNQDAPYCELVISPKLEKLREKFAELVK